MTVNSTAHCIFWVFFRATGSLAAASCVKLVAVRDGKTKEGFGNCRVQRKRA